MTPSAYAALGLLTETARRYVAFLQCKLKENSGDSPRGADLPDEIAEIERAISHVSILMQDQPAAIEARTLGERLAVAEEAWRTKPLASNTHEERRKTIEAAKKAARDREDLRRYLVDLRDDLMAALDAGAPLRARKLPEHLTHYVAGPSCARLLPDDRAYPYVDVVDETKEALALDGLALRFNESHDGGGYTSSWVEGRLVPLRPPSL